MKGTPDDALREAKRLGFPVEDTIRESNARLRQRMQRAGIDTASIYEDLDRDEREVLAMLKDEKLRDPVKAHLSWLEEQGLEMLSNVKDEMKDGPAIEAASWIGFVGGWLAALREEEE